MQNKVLIVYPYATGSNAFSGGVVKVALNNLRVLLESGYEAKIIFPLNNSGLREYCEANYPSNSFEQLDFSSLSLFSDDKTKHRYYRIVTNFIKFLFGMPCLIRFIKKNNYKIIHFHEIINFPFLLFKCRAKYIIHIHSYRWLTYSRLVNKFIGTVLNYGCSYIICPTVSIRDELKNFTNIRSEVVKTPYFETNYTNNLKIINKPDSETIKNKTQFGFIGRICEVKQIEDFFEAVLKLPKEFQNRLQFNIYGTTNTEGDISYHKKLLDIISNTPLEKLVIWHGFTKHIESVMSGLDCGILLSKSEAIPMVGLEFMKFNVPVIGYKVPGITDFLIDNVNGYLVDSKNIPELVNAIIQMINDHDLGKDWESSIQQEFGRYGIEQFSSNIYKIYNMCE